jgi:hypothetical protein
MQRTGKAFDLGGAEGRPKDCLGSVRQSLKIVVGKRECQSPRVPRGASADGRGCQRAQDPGRNGQESARAASGATPCGPARWELRRSAGAVLGTCGLGQVRCSARAGFGTCGLRHARSSVVPVFGGSGLRWFRSSAVPVFGGSGLRRFRSSAAAPFGLSPQTFLRPRPSNFPVDIVRLLLHHAPRNISGE